ncbi:MAG: 30S ribosome-binding factor RbfA [Gammaproteobacteria bacterium]|nr:30S ribosome-binding factor RbfA [Gammaproteobacteria bacterium]MYF38316.1 30S ribosome-binding factor RbfA [Gammaproteobacteria bacterium]
MRRVRIINRDRSFGREERVAELIRKELTTLIRQKMRDPRVTDQDVIVSDVRVSSDLASANVYVRALDLDHSVNRDELVQVLQRAAGFLRSELAKRHSMRTTPALEFQYDSVEDEGSHIDSLIDQAIARETSRIETHCE